MRVPPDLDEQPTLPRKPSRHCGPPVDVSPKTPARPDEMTRTDGPPTLSLGAVRDSPTRSASQGHNNPNGGSLR
jgi:hypothetical protein